MTSRQNRFSVGDIIDGKYEVAKVLPAGGMGELYKVRHIHLNDFRAVKVLKSNMLTDATQKQRFLREAKLAASIKHPNLASLFDFSSLPDGSYYMVQEFIDGVTLIETINSGETFDVPFILLVGQQVLGGLASLHEAGIIHRDISPDNLMLTKTHSGSTTIKIIDLGIAKPIDAGEGLTSAGFFVGKIHYASPEQAGMIEPGEKVDHRTDLYSVGVVLYQMVARRMPFIADNPQRYFLKQVSEEVAPINRQGEPPTVPAELEGFILRLLRKNRNERFASATEALHELVMISARLSTVAPSFVPGDTTRSVSEPGPLGGASPSEAHDDTDLFGNSNHAPVFSGSLDAIPLGQSQMDRTTAELPLINGISGHDRTEQINLSASSSETAATTEPTGEYPSAYLETGPAESSPSAGGPKTEALLMSDPARAFLVPDQEPTTVQPMQSYPTQMDTPSAGEYSRTVAQPVTQQGAYNPPPLSPKTIMEEDSFPGMDATPRVGATVMQSMNDPDRGAPGGPAVPVMPSGFPAAGAIPRQPVKRSGAIWVIALLLLLVLGAVAFAALKFLPFGGNGETTTIADQSGIQSPGTGELVIPVETPTPTPTPTFEVYPPDTMTQTAFGVETTIGPDYVPTPTPRVTPRTRSTPRRETATPTPSPRVTPTATPPPTPAPLREGELVTQGEAGVTDARISRWSPPRYPRAAERQRAEGTTTLRVLVGPSGQLEEVRVTTSSGFKILDDEAIDVARKSTFAPATKNGVALRMWIPVKVSFQRP